MEAYIHLSSHLGSINLNQAYQKPSLIYFAGFAVRYLHRTQVENPNVTARQAMSSIAAITHSHQFNAFIAVGS